MASYESFYQGTPSSLEPTYGSFTGYRLPTYGLGLTTDIRTAFQLKEASDKLSTGAKVIELSVISPEIMESIPQQHLKEINRLSKLTGTEMSVHGPMVEPSGWSRDGWSEENRKSVERQIGLAVERSHEISPQGNIPVTFHSSAQLPGTEYVRTKEGGKEVEREERIIAINQESGQLTAVKREEKFYPERGGEIEIIPPRQELDVINSSEWVNGITNLAFYKKEADEVLGVAQAVLQPVLDKIEKGEELVALTDKQKAAMGQLGKANLFLGNIEASFRAMFNKARKYPSGETEEEKQETIEKLNEISKKWKDEFKAHNDRREALERKKEPQEKEDIQWVIKKSALIDESLKEIHGIKPPLTYKPLDEFAKEQSSKTFANVAFESYKKFGDSAPVVSIENPPAGGALSRAEELKDLIESTRDRFVKKAKEEGYSESGARAAAEKLIGATWDVGHINMLRKYGFEKKELLKEAEKIAPFVKHVHLSDNFGFEHTELPMGMGNVPIKEMMEKLGKEGYNAKKIIEAGNWWQHFKVPPFVETLEAFGSPIYSMKMAPYWNQAIGFQQGYFLGYGQTLPEQHFSMYGAGFSGLPQELGGQIPGKRDRMSGTPMA